MKTGLWVLESPDLTPIQAAIMFANDYQNTSGMIGLVGEFGEFGYVGHFFIDSQPLPFHIRMRCGVWYVRTLLPGILDHAA